MGVSKGVIEKIEIRGDYFFTLPTEEFCSRIAGCTHAPDAVAERLAGIGDIGAYFNNISAQELLGLFF